jgi:hypothetical protein
VCIEKSPKSIRPKSFISYVLLLLVSERYVDYTLNSPIRKPFLFTKMCAYYIKAEKLYA